MIEAALHAACPNLPANTLADWSAALDQPLTNAQISIYPRRLAAFIGQTAIESVYYTRMAESFYYSTADRLCAVFPSHFPTLESAAPFIANPRGLAEHVYGGILGNGPEGCGDGARFGGGGLIETTGRSNYTLLARACGMSPEGTADWVKGTKAGAVSAAVFFWNQHNLSSLADQWEITAITRVVNGKALLGASDRLRVSLAALKATGGTA